MYIFDMMKNFHIQKTIMTTVLAVALAGQAYIPAQAQTSDTPSDTPSGHTTVNTIRGNTVCKTGSDADLPEIKSKVAKLADDLKRLKQVKQNSRASTSILRNEILAIDQELGPWRARHKTAAEQAGASADTYAVYKTEWIDTGALGRLNDKISLRKTKHANYKRVRAQYQRENTEFEALGTKYQHIARDLLDRDRDCAAAQAALR